MPEFLAPLDGSGSDDSNGGLSTRDNVVEKSLRKLSLVRVDVARGF